MAIADSELKSLIESELLNDERLSSQPIEVGVRNGVITLDGEVQSYRRQLIAHQIASHYNGVHGVVNNLRVAPGVTIPDDEVATHARSALQASADVSNVTVQVDVVGGKVTLTGNVGTHWERAIAEDVVRSVRGVRDVENLVAVDNESKIANSELASAIKAALSRTRGLTDAEVAVGVLDKSAVLTGRVAEIWQKEIAEGVVRRFGLLHVKNDISVETAR